MAGLQETGPVATLFLSSNSRMTRVYPNARKTAVRVANIPVDQFEEAVESDDPPTVTKLAEIG